jgi:hypothetical protein
MSAGMSPISRASPADIVVKDYLDTKVAGTLRTGQSLGIQRPGLCRADAHGVREQALAQQHVVAQLPEEAHVLGYPRGGRAAGFSTRSWQTSR